MEERGRGRACAGAHRGVAQERISACQARFSEESTEASAGLNARSALPLEGEDTTGGEQRMRRESRIENAGEAQAGAGREAERVTRSCLIEGRRRVAQA